VLLSIVAVVPAFGATGVVVRLHRAHQQALAAEWAQRAEDELAQGRPLEAAQAYRTALSYSRENTAFQLRLAQALARADRLREARAYLVTLATRDPSHGAVNLELARLAAREGEHATAVQHYHRAIDGYWAEAAAERRREARIELARYLVAEGDRPAAVAELMALAANLPADASLYTRAARALADAGAHAQALELFRRALEIDPRHAPALLGAGRAAFALADYRTARRYLGRYERADGRAEDAAPLLQALAHLSEVNAREPRLTIAQRAHRAARAFSLASARAACMPEPMAARLEEARPIGGAAYLRRNPDSIDEVFELALEGARAAARSCAAPAGADLALLTLAEQADGRDGRP
jgi:tetratricopeptide (TPR) repeat protein